jgi:hypothetical protein
VDLVDRSRDEIVKLLHRAGLTEVASEAQEELSDPVDTQELKQFCVRYGVSMDVLVDRMGGSP